MSQRRQVKGVRDDSRPSTPENKRAIALRHVGVQADALRTEAMAVDEHTAIPRNATCVAHVIERAFERALHEEMLNRTLRVRRVCRSRALRCSNSSSPSPGRAGAADGAVGSSALGGSTVRGLRGDLRDRGSAFAHSTPLARVRQAPRAIVRILIPVPPSRACTSMPCPVRPCSETSHDVVYVAFPHGRVCRTLFPDHTK